PTDALKVFRNDMPRRGNYAEFRLVGNPDAGIPMDGFGTKLTIYAGGRKFFRELQGGGGGVTGSQNSNVLHFGLGTADQFNIEVKYTNGSTRTYNGLHANQRFTIPYDGSYYVTSGVKSESGDMAESLALTNIGFSDGAFFFYLNGADHQRGARIDVINSIGGTVASEQVEVGISGLHTLRPSGALPAGVYFIRAISGGRSTVAGVRIIR
ncbi:MAG: ASPIC/UnbV domain-containing protein, partial [Candidatus Kapaibacterium sp.]